MPEEILKMSGITKVYQNGIVANKGVDFSVNRGEIHALAGENGAGKSTLMNILFGNESCDAGSIYLNGKELPINSPKDAIQNGIGMVHQHFMLAESLTVAENVFLGMEPKKRELFDMKKAVQLTEEISKKYNLQVDARAKVADIPIGMKQKVEILKQLLRNVRILILDEPTAVLTPQETVDLFKEFELLKKNGHTIIFISHKLKEIKKICDRVTILRNGRNAGVYNVNEVSEEDISRLMVGRDVVLNIQKKPCKPGKPVLTVRNLSYTNMFGKKSLRNVNFAVRSGEILGVAGVEGNGQSELVQIVTGIIRHYSGDVLLSGENLGGMSIRDIRRKGMAHIPEDRIAVGSAGEASIEENLIANRIGGKDFHKHWGLSLSAIHNFSKKLVGDYGIKCDSPEQTVGMLSGGNMQKVVAARELSCNPKLLAADQPTRGIDVGATEFIHNRLLLLREQGTAVILVSADLNEVLELSDSLIVLYGGEVSAYFENSKSVTEEELGLYMLGVKHQSEEIVRGALHEE